MATRKLAKHNQKKLANSPKSRREEGSGYNKGRAFGHTSLRQVSMKILDAGAVKGKPPYLYILVVVLCGRARTSSLTSRRL